MPDIARRTPLSTDSTRTFAATRHMIHAERLLSLALLIAATLASIPSTARSQDSANTTTDAPKRLRLRREWEGFAPGSSAQVQRRRIVYNEEGDVESSTTLETKSTLVSKQDGFNSVKMELKIDVAGRIFEPDANTLRFGPLSQKPGEKVETEHIGEEVLEVDDEQFKCQKFQVTIESESGRRQSRVWVSDVFPYVLKSEAVLTTEETEVAERISSSVIAMDMPIEVLSEVKSGAVMRIVTESDGKRSVTLEASCPDVPGGLVWHSQKVLVDGQLQEESHLRLIEYRSERDASDGELPPRRRLLPRLKRKRQRSEE